MANVKLKSESMGNAFSNKAMQDGINKNIEKINPTFTDAEVYAAIGVIQGTLPMSRVNDFQKEKVTLYIELLTTNEAFAKMQKPRLQAVYNRNLEAKARISARYSKPPIKTPVTNTINEVDFALDEISITGDTTSNSNVLPFAIGGIALATILMLKGK